MRINRFPDNRFGLHEIYCMLPWKQLTSVGSKVRGGVGRVGRWVGRGSDGRQTCGAEVAIVVLMVFLGGGKGWCEGSSSHFCQCNDSAA